MPWCHRVPIKNAVEQNNEKIGAVPINFREDFVACLRANKTQFMQELKP